ncbi:uncharacterized protein PHACADRAFT_247309 [Phanerochaete carnosa HHB-10118-sp]|uniref:Uncharacterized protein n=1 Tax=Phanerochaete carnosa (strain HHB-10118-sp) TaxID=650164 RepID=K5WAP3_PHACS|nr:uncharacterized protein PHACADRAFT_247309 [Phanerochaete carnosa HHB-10118-sp]EKM61013.1 hypothetical protein PHACADRAFT_247309 [Phanerochaete carnosa HHB-10118-sp]
MQTTSRGGWRDLSSALKFDNSSTGDDQRVLLHSPHSISGGNAPVCLISPLGGLDTWILALCPTTKPTELLVIQSSVPFSRAIDELCAMVARLSLQDHETTPLTSIQHPSETVEDICEGITSLSLRDPPLLRGEERSYSWDEEPFLGYIAAYETDGESVCDSFSDATYVEEDSTTSWTTVCGEDPERKESSLGDPKDVFLEDTLSCLHTHVPAKWSFTDEFSPPSVHTYVASVAATVGIQCWKLSNLFSLTTHFAPSLRGGSEPLKSRQRRPNPLHQ